MAALPDEQQMDRPAIAAARAAAPATGDAPGLRSLGKYQIKHKIGSGGMGAVYLAQDSELNRLVALKVLPKDKAENPILVKRFKAEAQAAAHLKHDNIVTLYEAGEADGHLYIAMEFVDGVDAFNLVQRHGKVPVRRSVDIVRQAARALQHAYEQGIVHRDIKPSNLMIRQDGMVKLADMGLARSIDEDHDAGLTQAGTTVGTVDYMSPEQGRNSKSADTRSDIYSLGCTWYHMLAGCAPYQGDSITAKLTAHAFTAVPDPRRKNPAVPETVIAVLHRMMAKSPKDRYQTPAELLNDLESTTLNRDDVTNEALLALANADGGSEPSKAVPTGARPRSKPKTQRLGKRVPRGELPKRPSGQKSSAAQSPSNGGRRPSSSRVRKSGIPPLSGGSGGRLQPPRPKPIATPSEGAPLPRLIRPSQQRGRGHQSSRYGWRYAAGGILLGGAFILLAWLLSALYSKPSEAPSIDAAPNPFASPNEAGTR